MKKLSKNTVLGVDIGATSLRWGVVDSEGKLVARGKEETPAKRGPEQSVVEIQSLYGRASKEYKIAAIGVGIPGPLRLPEGIVLIPPNIPWRSVPFLTMLRRRIKVPVLLENDANAAAVGESWVGAAKTKKNVVLLTVGTGIGGGLIIDGKLYRGTTGAAGELGHIPLNSGGPKCGAGHPGCFEAVGSAKAIADGRVTVDGAAGHWGRALLTYQKIFDPELFLLSGGGVEHAGLFRAILKEARKNGVSVPIERGALGEWAGVLGAARLAWDLV